MLRARRKRLLRQNELLEEFVGRIAERFPRSLIILFGSRGEGRPDSDYDILVVLDSEGDVYERIVELRSLKPRGIPVDVIILSPEEVRDPCYRENAEGASYSKTVWVRTWTASSDTKGGEAVS